MPFVTYEKMDREKKYKTQVGNGLKKKKRLTEVTGVPEGKERDKEPE